MDPQIDLPELVEDLEVNIDELTATLEPLLSKPLHTTASSLPLLDKAKLYTLSAYAIESILFSVLKASGVDVTEHPIFKEIARLKGYNSKIREAEERDKNKENRARLDVAAAGRFIKHGLAGNDKYDLERRERMAKEKARAHLKAQKMVNKKFDDDGKEVQSEDATPKKRGVDEVDGHGEDSDQVLGGLEEAEPAAKKARVDATEPMDIDSEASKKGKKKTKTQKTKAKKEAKKAKEQARQSAESTDASADDTPEVSTSAAEPKPEAEPDVNTTQPRKRGRPPKKDKAQRATVDDAEAEATPSKAEARVTRNRNKRLSTQNGQEEEIVVPTPDQAPKTRSETFNALLDGSLGEKNKSKKGGKKGTRGKGK
ncbi:Exosome-associated family protein [Pyrenophora tritici-repentis]|uniref:Exosome complex protein n=2 Tax=Pyrenophora tritici-repentis TaxID=45151 RepID=A0A922NA37_9PLEO|nr:exosome-associated family protein [Pyrenophora tritici-repentis Pt-1C-BFP]EDU50319.1 exosome-associated family protein [Pyrenophora tritici-repentis Pt-1C-BFP]KAI1511365.1 Exosome-associated family protein [Pyrenophora tritici-repentis]KAI1667406.1 Exosome-associated family protein [Pyrenophora tritici-repentis]KAI1679605.1 Exosome-associated family protein [Pyrenophora tritici-repentis]